MSLLDWLGPIGSGVQGLFNLGSSALGNRSQRKMQREQNEFNANQAEINRQFQSREAEIARDWQEQQYLQYSSPGAMVKQYNEAGLNPALMYGSNLQTSTGSSPLPSGSTASGTTPTSKMADLTGIAQAFLGLSKLKQDINESKSRENMNNAQAGLAGSQIDVNKQSINESISRISKLREETKNETEKRGLIVAQKLFTEIDSQLRSSQIESLNYDILKKRFDEQFKSDYGFYPANSLYESIWRIVQGIGESSIFKKLFNFN